MDNYKNVKGYICEAQCNSPRAEFIREYNSWFMTEDMDRIMSVLDEGIVWEMVGEALVEGIESVREFLTQTPNGEEETEMIEQRVDGILVDGEYGCSFGTIIMGNGDSYAFNDVIRFKDSEEIRIQRMKSFVVKLKS